MFIMPTDRETEEFLYWLARIQSNGHIRDYTQWYPLLYSLGIRCMSDLLELQNLHPEDDHALRGLLNVPPIRMKPLQASIFLRAINALPSRLDA